MRKVMTTRDVKRASTLKTNPTTTTDVLNRLVPSPTSRNIPRGHLVKGIRDINRIEWEQWEENAGESLRTVEKQNLDKANRHYNAMKHVQNLLILVRRHGSELQIRNEELDAINEELQASSEEIEASNEELRATTEELELTSSYLQTLMDNMLDILMTTDPSGVITEVNKATERISGYSREDLIGQPFSYLLTDSESAQAAINHVLIEGETSNYDLTIVTKDKREVPVSYNATVLRNAEGHITGVLGSARDTTEIKQAQELLRLANIYNRNLIEAFVDPLVTIDPKGRITDVNAATEEYTGHSREKLMGTNFSDYFTEPEKARTFYQQTFEEGSARDHELELLHRDGHVMSVLYNASVYRNEPGKVIGVIAVAHDISKRKKAEDALGQKANELSRSNEELEKFAYVASHDLQEPLRKIQAYSGLLQKEHADSINDEGKDYLERMQNAAQRMQALINSLLTFSRITSKATPFAPVDLTKIARMVATDLEMHTKEIDGRVEIGDLPTIDADPVQMRQLLQNLISNGLKFHGKEAPVVKISGRILDRFCQILVEDNGIGFDEKYLDRIFGVFQRLHDKAEYEGTGIGLAICKKIAEYHGGSITAKSTPGQGATFITTLPVKQSKGVDGGHQ